MDFWVRYFLKILKISEIPLEEAYKISREESSLFHLFTKKAVPKCLPILERLAYIYVDYVFFFGSVLWPVTSRTSRKNITIGIPRMSPHTPKKCSQKIKMRKV